MPNKIQFVPAEEIDSIWDEVEPMLQSALNSSFPLETTEDIKRGIEEKRYGMYVFYRGVLETVCVCDVLSSKEGDIFRVLYAASKDDVRFEWEIALEDFIGLAKSLGCVRFEIIGRIGWMRKFKDLGFKLDTVTIARDLRCQKEEVAHQLPQHKKQNLGMGKRTT